MLERSYFRNAKAANYFVTIWQLKVDILREKSVVIKPVATLITKILKGILSIISSLSSLCACLRKRSFSKGKIGKLFNRDFAFEVGKILVEREKIELNCKLSRSLIPCDLWSLNGENVEEE